MERQFTLPSFDTGHGKTVRIASVRGVFCSFDCLQPATERPCAPKDHKLFELSEFRVGDEACAHLLLRGFYPSEGEWKTRWTAPRFAVRLERPGGPQPVYVVPQFALPPEMLKAHPSVAISARVNGVALERQNFTRPTGEQYVAAVPESALAARRPAEVEFQVDQSIKLPQ